MPEIQQDIVTHPPGLLSRILGRTRTDVSDPTEGTHTPGFPWTYAEPTKRAIGSLFPEDIQDPELINIEERYPMGKTAIHLPVDEAFRPGIQILIDGVETERSKTLWKKYRAEWKRNFKLCRLYGHADMIYLWEDDMGRWQDGAPADGLKYQGMITVPKRYEQNLEETDTLPNYIKQLSVGYGNTTIVMAPGRFTHVMLPRLTTVDKKGQSIIEIMYNLLQVQIHADWSIGQALFRRASGLLALFAPKRNVPADQQSDAIGSIQNHNSKTALYIPFGWNIKDVLKPGGNMAIARTYNLITEQMATATGIPESILTKKKSPTDANESDRELFYQVVRDFEDDIIEPALRDWARKTQKAGMLEPGNIEIEFMPLESRTKLEITRDDTELGALQLLQKRIELAADPTTGTLTNPLADGTPDTNELVKLLSRKK